MEMQQQRRKRIKTRKKWRQGSDPKEDRISSLPDSLLIHILSFLPTTRYAIQTGTLSKRWLHLWTDLPVLIFDCFMGDKFSHFANHVDKTLTLHASPKLHKFQLSLRYLGYVNCIAGHLFSWLHFATLRQAQEMSLCFFLNFWDILPQFFYSNPWLHELKVQGCDLAPTGKVEWTSLRVLEIGPSLLRKETLHRILSGSPLLESLTLYCCSGIHEVDIGSSCSRLKTLVVDNIDYSSRKRYVTCLLSGSSIQHLEIYGCGSQKWELDNMPSLVSVKLHFQMRPPMDDDEDEDEEYGDEYGDEYHEVCRKVVRGLLEKVGHAEQLELGRWCIQVLSTLEVKGVPAPVIDCKLLIFKLYDINQRSFPGMASLLRSSSKLEKLAIDISRESNEYEFDDPAICKYEFEDNYWISNKRTCNCLFSHLKIVEIFSLRYHQYWERLIFQLIEFLLKNATLLEKMVVHQDRSWFQKDVVRMSKELSSFPRSSPCAVVKTRKWGRKL